MFTRRNFLQGLSGAAVGVLPLIAQDATNQGTSITTTPVSPQHIPPPPPRLPGPALTNRVVGIVLAGGGAKGSFEVGAVRYLYDQEVRPNVICGTSVGAINAIKLAEGEGSATQGLAGLEGIWLGLRKNSDMYVEGPWLSWVRTQKPNVYNALPGFLRAPQAEGGVAVTATSLGTPGPFSAPSFVISGFIGLVQGLALCSDLKDVMDALQQQSPPALYDLSPIQGLLARQLDLKLVQQWAAAGGKLRLATVALESGKVRYVTESGQLMERDGSTFVYQLPSVQPPSPACQQLLTLIQQIEQKIAALGPRASNPDSPNYEKYVELESQLNQAQQQLSTCQQGSPYVPDLRLGVNASAALPCFFVPQKLGNETYVDGGIRDVMPVAMAAQLGATMIYAVNDSPPLPSDMSYDRKNFLDIAERSILGIAIDEVVHEATAVVPNSNQVQVQVIQCTYAQDNDTVLVHPALIRINMSYGYMRAADTVSPVATCPDRCYQLSDSITQLRRLLFQLEGLIINSGLDTWRTHVPILRWGKGMLSLLIKGRYNLGGAVPKDVDGSRFNWEQHNQPTPAPSPFDAIGTVPADINVDDYVPKDDAYLLEDSSGQVNFYQQGFYPSAGVYVILGGASFSVCGSTPQEIAAAGVDPSAIRTVPAGSIYLIGRVPREGTLIKEKGADPIYLIQNCAKRWITSPAVFNSHGFHWNSVLTAPAGSLTFLQDGPPLTS